MTGLIEGLQGISAGALLGWVVAIVGGVVVVLRYLEKYRTLRNEHDKYKRQVEQHQDIIDDLKTEVDGMKTNYEDLKETLDKALTAINELSTYNKKRDMAALKDSIRHCYSVYHERGSVTEMEKESLEDLIASYEDAGGKNSFVHSLVVPEMYTWKVEK